MTLHVPLRLLSELRWLLAESEAAPLGSANSTASAATSTAAHLELAELRQTGSAMNSAASERSGA